MERIDGVSRSGRRASGVQAIEYPGLTGAGDGGRAMHQPQGLVVRIDRALHEAHPAGLHARRMPVEDDGLIGQMIHQGLPVHLAVIEPFGAWSSIGADEAQTGAVDMETAACVIADDLQSEFRRPVRGQAQEAVEQVQEIGRPDRQVQRVQSRNDADSAFIRRPPCRTRRRLRIA